MKHNKRLIVLELMISATMIIAIICIIVSPYSYDAIISEKYESPSYRHWFGTDALGRDILVRVSLAYLVSGGISFVAIIFGGIFGTVYGVIAGYYGKKTETIMVAAVDVMQCIPEILLVIFLMVLFNEKLNITEGNIFGIFIVIILTSWPAIARVAKNETKKVRTNEYVIYAKKKGASTAYIIFRHILPNIKVQMGSVIAHRIPKALMVESFLSYIGIGVQPPFPSLGKMIREGIPVIRTNINVLLFPSIALVLLVVLFNFICEAVSSNNEV